jgi:glyoxylase-like metal-dependent hydrolase (beta-lactamase superfamily II)
MATPIFRFRICRSVCFAPPGGGAPRAGVAIGDWALDLDAVQATGLLSGGYRSSNGGALNALFALGAGPARIGDYTDFYVGIPEWFPSRSSVWIVKRYLGNQQTAGAGKAHPYWTRANAYARPRPPMTLTTHGVEVPPRSLSRRVGGVDKDELFERLWNGTAPMQEWTQAVSKGAVTSITRDIITVHTTYFCGSVTAIRTAEGLVFIDTAKPDTAAQTLAAVRRWDNSPVHTVIYTHGHIDHTSGITLIDAEADARGIARPRIIAHRNVLRRLSRYEVSQGLNSIIQGQQFNYPNYVYPIGQRRPDEVYDDTLSLTIGNETIALFHGRGETDDATFIWLPKHRVLASGDFVAWVFPNAGNPRKVQRYAPDWAAALRQMQGLGAEVLIPGHGPVVFGRSRAEQMLNDGAEVLESLTQQTLELMNRGSTLDEVLHSVSAPKKLLAKPYLLPTYDDPEFVVRGIWHLYAGWFDGDPAHLKPAPARELATELASLVGGADKLAQRALTLAGGGQTRLAAHLVEFAATASPGNKAIQKMRASIYERCMERETSLMGKAIFAVYNRIATGQSERQQEGTPD